MRDRLLWILSLLFVAWMVWSETSFQYFDQSLADDHALWGIATGIDPRQHNFGGVDLRQPCFVGDHFGCLASDQHHQAICSIP